MTIEELNTLFENSETAPACFNSTEDPEFVAELVTRANTQGGIIVIGAVNLQEINGLSDEELKKNIEQLQQICAEEIFPILIYHHEIIKINAKSIIIVHIKKGRNKPYCDSTGTFWLEDHNLRKALKPSKLFRKLFQEQTTTTIDEEIVEKSSINDIRYKKIETYFENYCPHRIEDLALKPEQLLEAMNLMKNKQVNLACLMFFGKQPQQFCPEFVIRATNYQSSKALEAYCTDSEVIDGTIDEQFSKAMDFLCRNCPSLNQANTRILSLSKSAIQELLQNALIHRDYSILKPIELNILTNRIEIINPGCLPNNLQVPNIRYGFHYARNPLIASFASKFMPYSFGMGIIITLSSYPQVVFINDDNRNRFKTIIYRPEQ